MAQLVGLAEYLRLFVDQVKCFEDDNETQQEKLDSQKLEKTCASVTSHAPSCPGKRGYIERLGLHCIQK